MFPLRLLFVVAFIGGSLASPWRVTPEISPGDSPEISMNFCQLVTYNGYHCEEYRNVETSDGYLLTIHRVNGKKNETASHDRKPVFLQHGLIASSDSFVLNPPNDSLPYILSDAGFDVWLGNSRGNTYSMKHIKYTIRQKEFWDFSWQEMALYDLPTSIEFVLNKTNSKSIPYIGHSQGNLMALVHAALADTKITHIIALAPIFHVGNVRGPFKYLIPLRNKFGPFFEDLTQGEFLPRSKLSVWAADHLCNHPLLVDLCEDMLFVVMGRDSKHMNQTRVPIYISHMPDGCSVRDMLHYVQMMMSGNCSFYDFGSPEQNMIKYKQPSPPVFTAQQVTLPVSLFAGGKDLLADDKDVDYLRKNLPNLVNDVSVPDWNHADFLTATNMPEKIAKLIISILHSE